MNRKRCFPFVLLCLAFLGSFFVACHKDPESGRMLSGYQIELRSGDGQTDTIGNTLKKEIVFKVSKNNSTTFTGFVQIETSDCDEQPRKVEYPIERRIYPRAMKCSFLIRGN